MSSEPDTWTLAVLPTIDADGATQMGLDLALLDHADETPNTIWWRTYTWSRPTLSLGYFQAWKESDESVRSAWSRYDVVRRPSGGGAIVHHGDLTYAIVVPKSHPWTVQPRTLYRTVHDAIARVATEDGAALKRRLISPESGIPAESLMDRRERDGQLTVGLSSRSKPVSPFLCFEDGDSDDLVLDGAKIVGGAQRRRAWATLQHGSIRWKAPLDGPGSRMPGLIDLRPDFRQSSSVVWAASLAARLAEMWSLPLRETNFPAETLIAAHAWSRRLREPDWLNKR